ncbi:MAG: sensor histidine kinase KdpD [Thermoleophilaceae bacterium]|nr:sensor histidine kinase KdpD [Thermoleophilaceae bacterium]
MAAGVGKTFRMLREAQREVENGRDVVIGYLEPHDRAETIAESVALEELPRRSIEYKGTTVEEMDPHAVIARKPELALVDELAHTNAPGAEHKKRYEDVEDILAAGIDVFTTMNVQHLESLNDQISELTGTTVRETVPDKVLARADEVVLIDVTPGALIERLQEGKIYPADRIPSALNNFFKIENLTALRTVALRQVADDVESKRLTVEAPARRLDKTGEKAVPQAISERAMAIVTPHRRSQRIIRRAWRSAQRLGCPLDVVWVSQHDYEPTPDERAQLAAINELVSVLGAHFVIEYGDDVVETVQRAAAARGTTYLLLGPPSKRSGLSRWSTPSIVERLLRELPGVDIRVVADRSLLQKDEETR